MQNDIKRQQQIYSIKTKHLNFIISITLPRTHILHLTLQLSFWRKYEFYKDVSTFYVEIKYA